MLERHAMVAQHDCRMCCLCVHQECFDVGVWLDRRPECNIVAGTIKRGDREFYFEKMIIGTDRWKYPVSN